MLKKRISLLLVLTLAFSLFSFLITAQPACAKESDKAKTIHVDLNGDNKKETITFKPTIKQYDEYGKLLIYINGKKVRNIQASFYSYEYRFITVKGKKFLYIHTIWNNDDGIHQLFQYKNKKLTRVINFDSVRLSRWIIGLKVNGNELRVVMRDNGEGIGIFKFRSIYTYKNGHFKLKSRTHKVLGYIDASNPEAFINGVTKLTVTKKFKIYSDKTCKKKIGTVPVGAVVKLTKVYCTGDYNTGFSSYYITGGGYSGWYYSKDIDYNMLFDGVFGVA